MSVVDAGERVVTFVQQPVPPQLPHPADFIPVPVHTCPCCNTKFTKPQLAIHIRKMLKEGSVGKLELLKTPGTESFLRPLGYTIHWECTSAAVLVTITAAIRKSDICTHCLNRLHLFQPAVVQPQVYAPPASPADITWSPSEFCQNLPIPSRRFRRT